MRIKSDKEYLKEWQVFTENIRKSTPIDLDESEADKKKRMARLEADPEEWFKYYFPAFAYSEPMPFHKQAASRILDNPEWYEVRMWSRELAKSTRTMMEVFYLVLVGHKKPDGTRHKKRNVLMISNSEANAIRLLDPYRANFEHNDRVKNDYGEQENIGSWEAQEFITKGGASFRAIGAGQSPRGTRNQEVRPDIILFDDIDTDEECRNPDIIKKKWKWIEEAVMPTRSISKATTILFCGNRIAKDCCVERATKFADKHDEVNIRDEHGKSTWPTKNTEAHIDRVLKTLSYFAQQKEYFNNPITEGTVFKSMNYKNVRPLKEYSLLVCYTDPSYKESKKNDYKATVLVGKWKEEFHVIKALVFQGSTAQMIQNHYEIMDLVGDCGCYYFMEEVFLQEMFFKDFYAAGERTGRTIPIAGDQRAKPDKFVRIESVLEPLNTNEKLWLNDAERANPGMKVLDEQFLGFGAGSRVHDDGPDAVEGAIYKLNEKLSQIKPGSVKSYKRTRSSSKHY